MMPPPILRTERLTLREIVAADAPFVLEMVNDPGFIANIGDRGVRTEADAARHIAEKYTGHYARHGYGIYLVERDGRPIGTCGLVRRDGLPGPDLGYAFLSAHVGQGYGREAGEAVLRHARAVLGMDTILAFIKPDNAASAALLARLGFVPAGEVTLPGYPGTSLLFRHASPDRPNPLVGAPSLPPQESARS